MSTKQPPEGVFARGRKFERMRIAAIFNHPAAAECLDIAAALAFDTDFPVSECIRLLKAVRLGRRRKYADKVAASWKKPCVTLPTDCTDDRSMAHFKPTVH